MMRSIELGLGGNEPDAAKARFEQIIPAGRYGEPEEVAAMIHFLASTDCNFVNGQAIAVDGGFSAGMSPVAYETLANA